MTFSSLSNDFRFVTWYQGFLIKYHYKLVASTLSLECLFHWLLVLRNAALCLTLVKNSNVPIEIDSDIDFKVISQVKKMPSEVMSSLRTRSTGDHGVVDSLETSSSRFACDIIKFWCCLKTWWLLLLLLLSCIN